MEVFKTGRAADSFGRHRRLDQRQDACARSMTGSQASFGVKAMHDTSVETGDEDHPGSIWTFQLGQRRRELSAYSCVR